jgi:hypothetical protein
MRLRRLPTFAALLLCSACALITQGRETKDITATVRFMSFEGGFYALRGDDSVTYDPTNLPNDFKVDGLRVQSRVQVRKDLRGTHMAGPIVDIIQIKTLQPIGPISTQ